MDNAVALVQVYLRLNGYFTVTEYPVLEALGGDAYRARTDLDILAVRFAGAGRPFELGERARETFSADPALGKTGEHVDMIIGEVKEGQAELNRGATDARVLRAALLRFGCCTVDELPRVVERLVRTGHAPTPCGHHVRLVAFGSTAGERGRFEVITLGHVLDYLQAYIQANWSMLRHAQFKDPAFGFLTTMVKAAGPVAPPTATATGRVRRMQR